MLSGDFIKDQFYSETRTASELGISRTPVRDALLRLEVEGFVEIFPSKGYKIKSNNKKMIHEMYQMRAAIEGFCSFQMSEYSDSEKALKVFAEIEDIIARQKELLYTTKDIYEFADLDVAYHMAIVRFSENSEFERLTKSYISRMREFLENFYHYPERMQIGYQEHVTLINEIKSGEPERAYEYATMHMRASEHVNLRDAD